MQHHKKQNMGNSDQEKMLQSKGDEVLNFVNQLCAEHTHLLSSVGQDLLSGEQSINPYS